MLSHQHTVNSSVQWLIRVQLFATPWTAASQASLSITNCWSLLRLIESVMPSNHLILCHPLLLLPSIFPIIRVFSNSKRVLALHIRWPELFPLFCLFQNCPMIGIIEQGLFQTGSSHLVIQIYVCFLMSFHNLVLFSVE